MLACSLSSILTISSPRIKHILCSLKVVHSAKALKRGYPETKVGAQTYAYQKEGIYPLPVAERIPLEELSTPGWEATK